MLEPSKLLAYVRPTAFQNDQYLSGPILEAIGEFLVEVRESGWDIYDIDMPTPPGPGLWLLEGWREHADDEVHFVGTWRQLSHWEMCRLRCGMLAVGDEGARR